MESTIETGIGLLAVRVHGDGPTAVLWHGLFVDDRSWDRVADSLARERRLVRITGPGHGASSSIRRRYDLVDCAAAALAVLDSCGIHERVDWVGNGWGGHVGIVLAATHPRRVRTLAAFNSPVRELSAVEARVTRLLAWVLRLIGPVGSATAGVTAALLSEQTRAVDEEAVAYVRECLRAADRAALVNAIRSISLRRLDLSPRLPLVTAPTLFVTSLEDELWTPAEATASAAVMLQAETSIVAGGKHLTPLETPDETITLLTLLWERG